MALLGFKKRFAADVRSGKKRQTIRAKRKHPIKVGERLYLYTGLRQPGAEKLREADALSVDEIKITHTPEGDAVITKVFVAGEKLLPNEVCALAIADGFVDVADFITFFKKEHGAEFVGDLIKWDPDAFLKKSTATTSVVCRR